MPSISNEKYVNENYVYIRIIYYVIFDIIFPKTTDIVNASVDIDNECMAVDASTTSKYQQ